MVRFGGLYVQRIFSRGETEAHTLWLLRGGQPSAEEKQLLKLPEKIEYIDHNRFHMMISQGAHLRCCCVSMRHCHKLKPELPLKWKCAARDHKVRNKHERLCTIRWQREEYPFSIPELDDGCRTPTDLVWLCGI